MLKHLQIKYYAVPALNELQRAVDSVVRPIVALPILDGRLIESVDLSTTAAEIEHKLGRDWRGYIVTKASAAATVYDSASSDDSKFTKLTASTTVTVDLWVF